MAAQDDKNPAGREVDDFTGTETTGHEWDGIRELDTPMPRWWLWTYYATVVFSIGYVIAYPAIPLISSVTAGVLGYSSRAEVAKEMIVAKESQSARLSQIGEKSLEEIRKDPELFQFAVAGGASAYRVNCIQCHGAGAEGSGIYPNLNDDDWLWGGKLEDIHTTLKHGIRFNQDEETRTSEMPAFGRDEILERSDINDVAEFVLKLSNQTHDAAAAGRGATVYADNCAACHGELGKGDTEQGAPNLADAIWFYGGTKAELVAQVSSPKQGVMPAWQSRLDEATLKQLAIYVHSLGGGE